MWSPYHSFRILITGDSMRLSSSMPLLEVLCMNANELCTANVDVEQAKAQQAHASGFMQALKNWQEPGWVMRMM